MILDAKYLHERGLYEQCGERLNEAKGLAMDLDDQLSLLEINMADRELLRQIKSKEYAEIMERLIGEKEEILGEIHEELKYFDLSDKLILEVNRRFELRNEEEIEAFHTKYPTSIFEKIPRKLSGRSALRYLQSSALYFQLLRDSDRVLDLYSQVVQWWDENKKIREEEFHKYIIDVSNLLHAVSSKEFYNEIPLIIRKLEKDPPKNHHDQGMVFQKTAIYKLVYYINSGQSEGIDKVVEEVQVGLDKYQIKAGSRNALIFNTSVMLFMQEKFQQCADWNNRIIKGNKYITRRDIRNGVMLLNLVAVFELGDIEQFEGFFRKVTRYFYKKGMIEPNHFEKKIFNSFRDIYNSPPSELTNEYKKLEAYLTNLREDKDIKISLGLDELLLLWVSSKLRNKTIINQLREKHAGQPT